MGAFEMRIATNDSRTDHWPDSEGWVAGTFVGGVSGTMSWVGGGMEKIGFGWGKRRGG